MSRLPAFLTADADGAVLLTPPPRPRQRLRPANAVDSVLATLGAPVGALVLAFSVVGGFTLAFYALVACAAAGPVGWLAGCIVVPAAFILGLAVGAVAGVALGVGAIVWLAVALFHAL